MKQLIPFLMILGMSTVPSLQAKEVLSVPFMPGAIEEWEDEEDAALELIFDELLEHDEFPWVESIYDSYFMPAGTTAQDVWNYYAQQLETAAPEVQSWDNSAQSAFFTLSNGRQYIVIVAPIDDLLGVVEYLAFDPDSKFFEWEVWCDFNDNIFPSFEIATATMDIFDPDEGEETSRTLGDPDSRLGVYIRGKAGSKFTLTLKKTAIFQEITLTGKIPEGAWETYITPKVLFDYQALQTIRQPMPLNIVAVLELEGRLPEQKALTVTVRSINDCLLGQNLGSEYEEESTEYESFDWMFAAYVNENHPGVEKLLKQALDADIVKSFEGYGEADSEMVLRQVFAIWNVLQRQGVRYSSIDTTHSEDVMVWSQHVRFLDEVLENTQANCIDGTALFASVLRKIGLHPYLVMVPGHAFLAFSLDEEEESLVGLESTMIGDNNLRKIGRTNKKLSQELREKMKNEESWKTFEEALDYGSEALEEAMEEISKGEDGEYLLISISEARSMGVLPIGFAGN